MNQAIHHVMHRKHPGAPDREALVHSFRVSPEVPLVEAISADWWAREVMREPGSRTPPRRSGWAGAGRRTR